MSAHFETQFAARSFVGAIAGMLTVCIAGLAILFVLGAYLSPSWYSRVAQLTILAGALWLLWRYLADVWARRTWIFRSTPDRMTWLVSDRDGERVHDEIFLEDVESLLCHPGAEDEAPTVTALMTDGSERRLPVGGRGSQTELQRFVVYWQEEHPRIPITDA